MVAKIIRRVKNKLNSLRFAPKVVVAREDNLKFLGTPYGGWHFRDTPDLHGSTIISAGLGEDGSFDVEFAKTYGAKVIIVDPTPRAIEHFELIQRRIGLAASTGYVSGGRQPVDAYPLDGISNEQLVLIDRALWSEKKTLKFYRPSNPKHVSHSVVNFQNNYSEDTPYIEVNSITIQEITELYKIDKLEILKLDIEGAEISVLQNMMSTNLRPNQLLIEFDELIKPSKISRNNYYEIDNILRKNHYKCIDFDGKSNFLYVM